jgi:hypothetical protein
MAAGEAYYPSITAGDAASVQANGTVVQAIVQPNTFVQVFELSDTAYATPLTIKTPSGLTDTKVPVGSLPIFPDVYVVSPNFAHNWKSGDLVFRRDSADAKDKVVADSLAAAQLAAANAGAAAEAEVAARVAAGEFKGDDGRDGSNVVPTAQAIATEISTLGTPANAALSATVDANLDFAFSGQSSSIFQRILGWLRIIFSPLDTFHSKNYANLAELFTAADVAGACIIKIAPGSYTTPPLRLTKANITIIAYNATVKLANGANTALLAVGPDAVNIHVLGGRWDQNKANNTAGHGLYWEPYTGPFRVADRSNVDRAEIVNVAQDALHIARGRVEVKASRTQIRDTGRHGVFFGGSDSRFEAGGIGLCAVAGVWNENIGNWVKGNGIYYNGIGIRLTEGSRGSFISNNMIDVNKGVGIHIEGTTAARSMDAIIDSNLFLTNGFESDPLTSSDIYLQNASSVVMSGNIGSKKVDTWQLPAFAIRFGTGVAPIIDAGNRWEPAAYTNAAYSDPALIAMTTHRINLGNALSSATLLRSVVGSEAYARYEVLADGVQRWGSGLAASDVNLFRSAVAMLSTSGSLSALGFRMTATNGAGYIEGIVQTATPGGVADRGKYFYRKNAAGKTEACVVFGTGAPVVLGTEP